MYLHSYETRSRQEIEMTDRNIQKLSKRNIQRIEAIKNQQYLVSQERAKNCIFICMNGIPPFPNQFDFLKLPGKTYTIAPQGFDSTKTQEQRIKQLSQCLNNIQADRIRKVFDENPQKEVIFVYHSFGTYNLSTYLHKYGSERVKGLIEIGPAPIRHYLYITQVSKYSLGFSHVDLINDVQKYAGQIFTKFMEKINKQIGVRWDSFPSASYAAAFLSYFKSPVMPIMFDLNRRFPNILKCIIFGEEDILFEKSLLCQRAQYYSKQKINNLKQLKNRWNVKTQNNIQQNFIFMIPKGKHSVHLQKKNQQFIKKSVHDYLNLILN